MSRVCSVDGCGRRHRCKGLCAKHYEHQRLTRPPESPEVACSVRGCERRQKARRLCDKHYNRMVRTGSTEDPAAPALVLMREATIAAAAGRLEDYVWLLEQGLPRARAAERLGLSERTIYRYDARLREGAGDYRKAA